MEGSATVDFSEKTKPGQIRAQHQLHPLTQWPPRWNLQPWGSQLQHRTWWIKNHQSQQMPALYQKGPLFFLWARYPTNSNTWRRKPSAVPRYQSPTAKKKIQVENPQAPQDRNHIGARPRPRGTPPSWFWGLVCHAPKIGLGLPEKPWEKHRKTIFKASKRGENKGTWQSPSKCNGKREQQKNHPCKYRCTCCLSVYVRVHLHVNVRMHLQVACST